jgi:hypothetical protein
VPLIEKFLDSELQLPEVSAPLTEKEEARILKEREKRFNNISRQLANWVVQAGTVEGVEDETKRKLALLAVNLRRESIGLTKVFPEEISARSIEPIETAQPEF